MYMILPGKEKIKACHTCLLFSILLSIIIIYIIENPGEVHASFKITPVFLETATWLLQGKSHA